MRAFMWTEMWGDQRKMCATDYHEGVTISVRLMSQGGFSFILSGSKTNSQMEEPFPLVLYSLL